LRFYPVSSDELTQLREDFVQGRFKLRVEQTVLKLRDYRAFLESERRSISAFKNAQQAAFDAERERWEATGQAHYEADPAGDAAGADAGVDIPAGCMALASPVTGSVWQVRVKPGERVEAGQALVVVEAMKMEIAIEAEEAGEIVEVLCAQGSPVSAGQMLLIVRPVD
jgi:urea carboxylase